MKINSIKINSYGKLKNKNFNLEKINIIYGKNESGKSTLLNFILNLFFNISKNKNGKSISDYEKYFPWNENEFSGKINYQLDDNKKYDVFRDFNKKNPQIINENGNDISNNFNIDKKIGNLFFQDQIKIDKNTMLSTVVASQNETRIDNTTQNLLIQKIANLAESGQEDVSYKNAINKLDKLLLSEVGTNKSQNRPINIAIENLNNYEKELNDIKKYEENKYEIEKNNKKINEEIINEEKNKEIYEKIEKILNKNKISEEQINIKKKILEENKIKIENLKEKINNEINYKSNDEFSNNLDNNLNNNMNYKINNNLNKNISDNLNYDFNDNLKNKKLKNNKINIIFYLILIIILIINIFNLIFIKNKIINILLISLIPIWIIGKLLNNKNKYKENNNLNKNINNNIDNNINNNSENIKIQIETLENTNIELNNEIEELQENLKNENLEEKNKFIENYGKDIENLFDKDILLKTMEENKNNLNSLALELHKLKLDSENIEPKLEKIADLEEKIYFEKENLNKLENKSKIFEMTKELINDAYLEMKNNITPKFNKNLSKNIEKISNGKYKKIVLNDDIFVELENGNNIPMDLLSTGTIEQIYLALRLSVIDEISSEKLPIMLDETFAYYDNERLEETLKFLAQIDNQIIIFSCTDREKDIFNKLNINYNLINL